MIVFILIAVASLEVDRVPVEYGGGDGLSGGSIWYRAIEESIQL